MAAPFRGGGGESRSGMNPGAVGSNPAADTNLPLFPLMWRVGVRRFSYTPCKPLADASDPAPSARASAPTSLWDATGFCSRGTPSNSGGIAASS